MKAALFHGHCALLLVSVIALLCLPLLAADAAIEIIVLAVDALRFLTLHLHF